MLLHCFLVCQTLHYVDAERWKKRIVRELLVKIQSMTSRNGSTLNYVTPSTLQLVSVLQTSAGLFGSQRVAEAVNIFDLFYVVCCSSLVSMSWKVLKPCLR